MKRFLTPVCLTLAAICFSVGITLVCVDVYGDPPRTVEPGLVQQVQPTPVHPRLRAPSPVERATNSPEGVKVPKLIKLVIVSGKPTGKPVAASILNGELRAEVESIVGKQAHYVATKDTLFVGLDVKGVPIGEEIAAAKWSSNCLNNSQYDLEAAVTLTEANRTQIKHWLVAWTRHLHYVPKAPVLVINESPTHFDIQLNMPVKREVSQR